MKEHIRREMVNELRDLAVRFHAHQCLRELISNCIGKYECEQQDWDLKHDKNRV